MSSLLQRQSLGLFGCKAKIAGFCLAICLTAIHTDLAAQEPDASDEVGITKTGLRGIHRIGVPFSSQPGISVAGSAGYGFIEKIGPAQGSHHRLRGTLGVGAVILPQLALGIQFAGRSDFHPDDENGSDPSIVGDPRFLLRGGFEANQWLQLGAEALAWMPGGNAPSIEWDATTLDTKLLAAASPSGSSWNIALMAGFRWDNSSNASPGVDRVGPSERISLGLSDFNAILVGLGGAYRISMVELIGELTADLYVGDGSPSAGVFPWRIDAGARYNVTSSLQLELLAAAIIGKRPNVGPSDPLLPIEPRFSVTVGISYTWGFGDRDGQEPIVAPEPDAQEEEPPIAPKPPTTTVEGKLINEEGEPVVGATMRLTIGEETFETETDKEGSYIFEKVPLGEAKLTATADGFEGAEWVFEVTPDMQKAEPRKMISAELGSLIKGLVRSFRSKGLKAYVTIMPLGIELQTDADGRFQSELPPGSYTLSIKALGYRSQTKEVKVEENSVIILNVDMHRRKNR